MTCGESCKDIRSTIVEIYKVYMTTFYYVYFSGESTIVEIYKVYMTP